MAAPIGQLFTLTDRDRDKALWGWKSSTLTVSASATTVANTIAQFWSVGPPEGYLWFLTRVRVRLTAGSSQVVTGYQITTRIVTNNITSYVMDSTAAASNVTLGDLDIPFWNPRSGLVVSVDFDADTNANQFRLDCQGYVIPAGNVQLF